MHCCLKQQIFLPLVTIQRMKNCRAKLNSTGSFILKGLAAWPQHQQLSPEAAAARQRPRLLRDDTNIEPRGFLLLFPTPKPNEWSHSASEVRRKHQLFLTFESHTPANHILEKILLHRLRDTQGSFSFLDFKGFKKALTHSQPIEFRHVFLGLLSFMNVKVILTSIKTLDSW